MNHRVLFRPLDAGIYSLDYLLDRGEFGGFGRGGRYLARRVRNYRLITLKVVFRQPALCWRYRPHSYAVSTDLG